MGSRLFGRLAACAVLAVAASAVSAAVPQTSVSWVEQTGTASTTDSIEVWVRLTVDSGATEPLHLDGTQPIDLPPNWASIDSITQSAGATCSTNFFPLPPLTGCADPASPYVFAFNYGADSFLTSQSPILPGQSRDFLVGAFTPQNGPVAPGVYSFSDATLQFVVTGTDVFTDPQTLYITLGETCATQDASCAFTRTVVSAVPEPASLVLLAGGLALLGWRTRRQVP